MSQIINFNRVARARLFYRNDAGHIRTKCPTFLTCCNDRIPDDLVERYKAKSRVDRWTTVVVFQFTRYDAVEFTGEKANQYWGAYAAHVFGKEKFKSG